MAHYAVTARGSGGIPSWVSLGFAETAGVMAPAIAVMGGFFAGPDGGEGQWGHGP